MSEAPVIRSLASLASADARRLRAARWALAYLPRRAGYYRPLTEVFEDYRPEVESFLDAGDKVVTLAIEQGRGRGSGVEVESRRTAHVWTIRDGTAIRLDLYLDRKRALKAVGLEE
jgi:ketosteroid isomerase-like protein